MVTVTVLLVVVVPCTIKFPLTVTCWNVTGSFGPTGCPILILLSPVIVTPLSPVYVVLSSLTLMVNVLPDWVIVAAPVPIRLRSPSV